MTRKKAKASVYKELHRKKCINKRENRVNDPNAENTVGPTTVDSEYPRKMSKKNEKKIKKYLERKSKREENASPSEPLQETAENPEQGTINDEKIVEGEIETAVSDC